MKLRINLIIVLVLIAGFAFAQRNTTDTFSPVTITGSVSEVNHPIATFKSDDGTLYQIHMGPYWYWLDNGYKLNNETATIKGEVKSVNGVNELYPVEVTQNGNTIKLTDDKGVPLWAGYNGSGNGRGYNGYALNNGNCKYDSVKCANCTNPGSCCNNNGSCRYGKGRGNGNGYGWRNGNGNGNGNGRGNCWRNNSDNSSNNSNKQNGNGWRQNCPNRTK